MDDLFSPYDSLLFEISRELTIDDIRNIQILLRIPTGEIEGTRNPQELLRWMSKQGKLSQNNLQVLKSLFSFIKRMDLADLVDVFVTKSTKPAVSSGPYNNNNNNNSDKPFLCLPPPTELSQNMPEGVLAAAGLKDVFWPNGTTIHIYFMDGSPTMQEKVFKVASTWLQYAKGLRFVRVDNASSSHVRISFQPGGSWSYLGTICLKRPKHEPTMNLGWLDENTEDKEVQRVVLHEFGHALGLVHEHQNPNVNFEWDVLAVKKYFASPPHNWTYDQIMTNILNKHPKEKVEADHYDEHSIMLYQFPSNFFLGKTGPTPLNVTLSVKDQEYAGKIYPALPTVGTILPPSVNREVRDLTADEIFALAQFLDQNGVLGKPCLELAKRIGLEEASIVALSRMETPTKALIHHLTVYGSDEQRTLDFLVQKLQQHPPMHGPADYLESIKKFV